MSRRLVVIALLAFGWLAGFGPSPAEAAPKAVLWERWTAHDPDATARIDHGAWGDLLARYLVTGSDGINRFAYREVTPEDLKRRSIVISRGFRQVTISDYARVSNRWLIGSISTMR